MSRLYPDNRSGFTQLEDALHALHALHDVFPGITGDGMPTQQQLGDFWFLMKELVQQQFPLLTL